VGDLIKVLEVVLVYASFSGTGDIPYVLA